MVSENAEDAENAENTVNARKVTRRAVLLYHTVPLGQTLQRRTPR